MDPRYGLNRKNKGHPICECTCPKLKTKQLVQDCLDDLSLECGELKVFFFFFFFQ